jgi:hypothetical protein
LLWSGKSRSSAEGALAIVAKVEEAVHVMLLLVDGAHQGRVGRQDVVDEDEDRFLGR